MPIAGLSRLVAAKAIPGAALLAALVAIPALIIYASVGGAPITALIHFLALLVAVMALGVFTGNSGILSFGHVAFMALGAQVSATLTMAPALKRSMLPLLPDFVMQAHLGLWPALLVTLIVVGVVALLVGLPICRLGGSSASIATLGLLIIVNSVIIGAQGITRGSQAMYGIPRLIDVPTALLLALAAVVVARLFRDSVPGLLLRASRDNEAAAQSIGVDVPRQRLIAWVVSAMIASVAGVVTAHQLTVFSAKEFYFGLTFAVIVMQVVGGMMSVTGSVAGAILITLVIEVLRRLENGFDLGIVQVPQVFGLTEIGLSLIVILTLYWKREGLFGYVEIDPFRRRGRQIADSAAPQADAQAAAVPVGSLVLERLSKSYGGLLAVDGVDLSLRTGEILGLIGPNGSGKTTLLGCLAGTHRASAGRVLLDGRDITRLPAYRIARLGIGRTFQTIRLFAHLTVQENIEAALAQRHGRAGRREIEARAEQLLDQLRIAGLKDRIAGTLAYGQQRRVEIARALALDPRFLLLDEPAAGMNEAETADLMGILAWLARERGLGLLVVDHDMSLIMRLCHRVAVLNKGQLIASGAPAEVQRDPAVREAYLGRRHAERMIA
ncbi:MAG: branched-chain amino acid transport system ATP-binding protein livM [Rhodospirillaceae bacterium]|nr:branched-chain amino acid transport system ATP-binding protein livM [Rhodospirillaceae bacterium]